MSPEEIKTKLMNISAKLIEIDQNGTYGLREAIYECMYAVGQLGKKKDEETSANK